MKNLKLILSMVMGVCFMPNVYSQNVKKAFAHAEIQDTQMLKELELAKVKMPENNKKEPLVSPRTLENGELKLVASKDWTSGFFPGELWYLYEYVRKKALN